MRSAITIAAVALVAYVAPSTAAPIRFPVPNLGPRPVGPQDRPKLPRPTPSIPTVSDSDTVSPPLETARLRFGVPFVEKFDNYNSSDGSSNASALITWGADVAAATDSGDSTLRRRLEGRRGRTSSKPKPSSEKPNPPKSNPPKSNPPKPSPPPPASLPPPANSPPPANPPPNTSTPPDASTPSKDTRIFQQGATILNGIGSAVGICEDFGGCTVSSDDADSEDAPKSIAGGVAELVATTASTSDADTSATESASATASTTTSATAADATTATSKQGMQHVIRRELVNALVARDLNELD